MLFSEFLFRMYPGQENRIKIINLFRDYRKAKLSIHNICSEGMENFDTNVGEFWRPLTSIICLGRLACEAVYSNDDNSLIF